MRMIYLKEKEMSKHISMVYDLYNVDPVDFDVQDTNENLIDID